MRERGFTYLWLLFVLALAGAALATAGQRWSTITQRERERDLAFRGDAIAQAIAAYRGASAPGAAPGPASLEDLLEDRRSLTLRRYLRQVYLDPFTGRADWVVVRDDRGAIMGVHSRARVPAMRRDRGETVGDWAFTAAPAPSAPSAASGASGASGAS
ncbi:MAG: type II secretion system protein, partial [Burkholderiales bacterium]|nr:type II secretion system protein [Burkholderiales bacterium]